MGEQPEESLAGMSHFQCSPCCFLALLSLVMEECPCSVSSLAPEAAGHTLICPPFASCASLACLPSPCSAWQVSAAEPKDCQGVLDSVCKACKEVEKVILSGAGEEERGKRSDAMRICFIPLRKTKHLCNDLMTLEIFFNLNDSVIL